MTPTATRIYAGHLIRELRKRLGVAQAALAGQLGISVSYLSQIESGDRPITKAVLVALARQFPADWATIDMADDEALLLDAIGACDDPSVPESRLEPDIVARGIKQHPLIVRRMVALHNAYMRSQRQLRALDDRVEAGIGESGRLPWEHVRDWFHTEHNYVDALDHKAERLAEAIFDGRPVREALEAQLADRFGVRVTALAAGSAMIRVFDPDARTLAIDPAQTPETALFSLAHQLIRLELTDVIDGIAGDGLRSDSGRDLLTAGLANYAAGALLMPYRQFRAAALAYRHDIDRLRQQFGTSFEQTCHRLSTLQRPGALGTPFFFCRVDMAGNITKRHSATRLQFAQYGGACPLWVVHEAVAIPDRVLVQLAATPDGTRYVSMAKGLVKPSGSYLQTPRRYAVALGCEVSHARDFIYADGLQIDGGGTPIGISCRICPRTDCDQRAFPPAGRQVHIQANARGAVPYAFR